MLNDLTIILYSSTKGHFGFKNSYQFTIEKLKKNLGGDFWRIKKYCNIKRSNEENEREIFLEMCEFLQKNDFYVLNTCGNWSHNNSSHAVGYYQDMFSVFKNIPHTEFTLVIEDDWLIHSAIQFNFAIEFAIKFLKETKNALCFRVNSEPDRRINGATKVREFQGLYRQDEDFTKFGSTFTFQPTIVRTRDWWHSLRIINNNLHLLDSVHCEILSGQVFKQFSDDKSPFYFFDPELIWCEHIGEKEKLERLNEANVN
jgi:hypothetical protein